MDDRRPCNICHRAHRGPKCKAVEDRSKQMCITFPGHVWRRLTESVPWGERSRFVARAVENALEAE